MSFIALTADLHPRETHCFGMDDAHYAHAAVLTAIHRAHPDLSHKLHSMHRHKCYTISLVVSRPGVTALRMTFLGEEGIQVANAFMNTITQNPVLDIGKIRCDLGPICLQGTPWTATASWADLMADPIGDAICFTFETSTAIKKHDPAGNGVISLLPTPIDVFSGLGRRWQALDGPSLPPDLDEFLSAGECVISDYHL